MSLNNWIILSVSTTNLPKKYLHSQKFSRILCTNFWKISNLIAKSQKFSVIILYSLQFFQISESKYVFQKSTTYLNNLQKYLRCRYVIFFENYLQLYAQIYITFQIYVIISKEFRSK